MIFQNVNKQVTLAYFFISEHVILYKERVIRYLLVLTINLKHILLIKFYHYLNKLFFFLSFSICFKLFLGVGKSSGIIPP